jgi:hypothetical protein
MLPRLLGDTPFIGTLFGSLVPLWIILRLTYIILGEIEFVSENGLTIPNIY